MPQRPFQDHRLVVYLFAPLSGPNRTEATATLRRVWQLFADRLGLTQPISESGAPADPPAHGDGVLSGRPVAARHASGRPLREAWWDHESDVACVSLTLSRDGDGGWQRLYAEWSALKAEVDLASMLGTVEILTALVTGTGEQVIPDPDHESAIFADLQADLPSFECPPAPGWNATATATRDGLCLWQTSSARLESSTRNLVVLAPQAKDDQLGQWVWAPGMAPLARILLDACVLRYQARVVRHDRDGVRQQRLRIAEALHGLQTLVAGGTEGTDDAKLREAQHQLTTLQANESGLIDTLVAVRLMRRTVQIASANMAAVAAHLMEGPGGKPLFRDDQALAAELDQQLDDEASYLEAARERAQHFLAIAQRALDDRVQRQIQAGRERQERFTLVQTAIIGAALMALTAIQSFGYKVPLAEPAQPAVIAALVAVAFYLSAIALRLATPAAHQGQPWRRTAWLTTVEALSLGAVAATLAWAVIELVPGVRVTLPPFGLLTALVTGVFGFLIGSIGSVLATRRRRRRAAQRQ